MSDALHRRSILFAAAGLVLMLSPAAALAQGRGWRGGRGMGPPPGLTRGRGPDGMGPPGLRRRWGGRAWVPPGRRRRGGPPPGRGWRRWD